MKKEKQSSEPLCSLLDIIKRIQSISALQKSLIYDVLHYAERRDWVVVHFRKLDSVCMCPVLAAWTLCAEDSLKTAVGIHNLSYSVSHVVLENIFRCNISPAPHIKGDDRKTFAWRTIKKTLGKESENTQKRESYRDWVFKFSNRKEERIRKKLLNFHAFSPQKHTAERATAEVEVEK